MNAELDKILKKVERCSVLLQEIVQDLDKLNTEGTAKKREHKQRRTFRPEEHSTLFSLLLEEWKSGRKVTTMRSLGSWSK